VIEEVTPIAATFLLEPEDRKKIGGVFGDGVLLSDEVILSRHYDDGTLYWCVPFDHQAAVRNVIEAQDLPTALASQLTGPGDSRGVAPGRHRPEGLAHCRRR
jgi:hypothetical protein